uniref:Protein TsetseEP domain-containing protein n=1 Tax=Anopheles minimus TaxID=112268 RepID=A0A182W7L0_9DIPT
MKAFPLVVALFLGVLSVTLAQRETSLRVIDALRELHPAYKELRDVVVNAVAGAKLNSSEVVFKFNVDIASRKESFMQTAIKAEANVLRQVNGQSISVDTSCLGFLRQSVDVNMNLAGVSFTNCLNNVDASLSTEITRVYSELQVNETSFVNLSVYDVFRGQNVFVNPQAIVDRLVEKLSSMQQAPAELTEELSLLVDAFEARLGDVRAAYTSCLTMNDQLLQNTLNTVLQQLQQICLGALLPAASTSEPTEATEAPAPTESVTEPAVPTESEAAATEVEQTELRREWMTIGNNIKRLDVVGSRFIHLLHLGEGRRHRSGTVYYYQLQNKMKALLLLALLSVAISAIVADRDESLRVFTELKRVKKGRSFGAGDDFVSDVQSDLLLAEEEYVRSSIDGEASLLQELATAEAQASGPHCVDFIRQKTGLMLNLAGVSYTSCLHRVDDALYEKLSKATDGAVTRTQYDQANMLNAFRGENIFVDPARIRSKLQQRMRATLRLPTLSAPSLMEMRGELDEVKEQFVECMKEARAGLDTSLEGTTKQYQIVCAKKEHLLILVETMKNFIVLLALIGTVVADRPETVNVITTFKQILPLYNSSTSEKLLEIATIKSNLTNQLVDIHLTIIARKEQQVQNVIQSEDVIHHMISAQTEADTVCLSFVNASSDMNVNLAGVSFTNCINTADEAIQTNVGRYYTYMNDLEQQISWIRLLDVFRGHNVFHSPQPIVDKLNAKIELLRGNNVTETVLKNLPNQAYYELRGIQERYDACMREAFVMFEQGVTMCQMQMRMICGAELKCQCSFDRNIFKCSDTINIRKAVEMKLFVLVIVLAVIAGSSADRPDALEVIETFKQIVPQYRETIGEDQQQIFMLKYEGTEALMQFHSDLVLAKETFIKSVTLQEDRLIGLMKAQNTSVTDGQCMQFIANATNEAVNIIGVAYTTCINAADESIGNSVLSYHGTIGALEQSSSNVRLLDVFRGDNVFYTPDNIVAKLRQKETDLMENRAPLITNLEVKKTEFEADLVTIRTSYIECMTTAEISFRSYIELARQQLSYICGGDLTVTNGENVYQFV